MPVPGLPNPLVSIHLKNVSIHTNHGVSEAEREVGQRMLFSVDLILPECPATETDELEGTIDYGSVTELLVETATETGYLTLERLAAVIAERMLENFDATWVKVSAAKPEPPIPVNMDFAGVEVTLTREPGAAAS